MHRLPTAYRWAKLDAPELPQRVANLSAFHAARGAESAARVVLMGPPGSGKTSLGVAIGRAAMAWGDCNGMFVTALELDRARRETTLGRGDAPLVEDAIRVPVLVLDELGMEERASTAVPDVVHARHAENRVTIVTLALDPKVIEQHYSSGIARRLFEAAAVIRCDWAAQPVAKREVVRMPRIIATFHAKADGPFVPAPREFLEAVAGIGKGGG
jgi:DNA replication protein DnaC